jgi:uncharacterized membrane protein
MARTALSAARRARAGETARAAGVAQAAPRIASIDALRGIALIAMIAYHFCFDLRMFGFARFAFETDWRWLAARSIILGTFLFLAGVSVVLLRQRPGAPARFLRHVALIAAAAIGVTVASRVAFPERFIWFGVLHAIAVSVSIAWPLASRPRTAGIAGLAVIAAGLLFSHPFFDNRVLGWIGFMTFKPPTEDYVPLFPWAGVVLVGVASGQAVVHASATWAAPLARLPGWIAMAGRHSLAVYLVHQPVLIGVLWAVAHA